MFSFPFLYLIIDFFLFGCLVVYFKNYSFLFPRGVSLIYLFFLRKAKLWKKKKNKRKWCWKSQSILEVIAWKMVWCLSYKHLLIGFFFVSKIESSKSVNLNVFTKSPCTGETKNQIKMFSASLLFMFMPCDDQICILIILNVAWILTNIKQNDIVS